MDVTVAICTWNRAALLDQTLAEMHHLRIPDGIKWELLIVNNNCTDATDEVIAGHSRDLPIRRLFESRQGHSYARNSAVDAARGELLLWTDDDVLVDREWLAALADAAYRYPDAAGFGGPVDPWFPTSPDPDLMAAFPALRVGFCGLQDDRPEGPTTEHIAGANMALRTTLNRSQLFDPGLGMKPLSSGTSRFAVGGYDEKDVIDRLRRRGAEFYWVPGMKVKHYVDPSRMTLTYLKSFVTESAKQQILVEGAPKGPRLFGVPRWLYRQRMETLALLFLARMRGSRLESLKLLSKNCILRGMTQGCRCLDRKYHVHPPA